jgi:hypothetical protein
MIPQPELLSNLQRTHTPLLLQGLSLLQSLLKYMPIFCYSIILLLDLISKEELRRIVACGVHGGIIYSSKAPSVSEEGGPGQGEARSSGLWTNTGH